jgi:DNA-directed RNA polymerase subunit RPC12/RpoP
MPIRFRCAYCSQLMGIGRRKAGTVVRCPRCAGEVIVPVIEQPQAANGSGPKLPLLEMEDFDKDFALPEPEPLPNPLMPPPAYHHAPLSDPERRAEPSLIMPPIPSLLKRRGLFLSVPTLFVGAILLLGAFGGTALLFFFFGRWTAL